MELLLDEAKSMLELGEYHDHIVNLQGVLYEQNKTNNDVIEIY